jgi:hypothetical protein
VEAKARTPELMTTSDDQIIKRYLLRHPFIHFSVTFCYWFTGASLIHLLFPSWSSPYAHHLSFVVIMAVAVYLLHRHFIKRDLKKLEIEPPVI